MKRASLAVCALGGVLLLLAGCSSLELAFDLAPGGTTAEGTVRVIDGSPETVAVTLQDTLKKRGLKAEISKDAQGVLVESETAGKLRFGLLLKNARGEDGREQTHVSLVWMGSQDQTTGVQVLADIDRQTGVKK